MNADCRRGLHNFKDYGYWCHHEPKHTICIRCDLCGFEEVGRSDRESESLRRKRLEIEYAYLREKNDLICGVGVTKMRW